MATAKSAVTTDRPAPDPAETVRAYVESRLEAAQEEAEAQLAQAPFAPLFDWEVVAWGPFQLPFNPALDPGRIIFTGESATVATAVFLNAAMAKNIAGFGGKIQLSYFTSNMQTMQPASGLSRAAPCIEVVDGRLVYVDMFTFTPSDAACLYEMNICARICNCLNTTVPGYGAFVRHVFDYDPEHLGLVPVPIPPGSPGWQFDRPIRFMVADNSVDCCA